MSHGFVTEVANWYTASFRRSTTAAAIIVIPWQTASTGMMSSRFFSLEGSWRKEVPSKYESDAEVLIPSFHPRKGFLTDVSTIAGRTIATGNPTPRLPIIDSARLLVS